jgi:hypothetical protein
MKVRVRMLVALLAATAAVAMPGTTGTGQPLALNDASASVGKQRAAGAREKCSTRSEADFPAAFTSADNLIVGPLAFVGAGGLAEYYEPFRGQKFQAVVRNGHRVTVALPRAARPDAGLAYGPLPHGVVEPEEAHRVVRFVACRRGQDSGSTADGRPVTFWSGGVLVRSPRCVPLRIRVDGRFQRNEVIRLGVARCAQAEIPAR